MIRTVNAILALGVFALYILHTILNVQALVFYTFISWSSIPGALLFALVIIHAVVSIFLVAKQSVLRNKEKRYLKLNKRSLILMITGLAILVLILIHNVSFGYTLPTGEFIVKDPSLDMFVVNVLLAVALSIHCSLSLPNACLTLGFTTKSTMVPVKVISSILSIGLGVAAIVSYCLYYLPSIISGGMF